MLKRIMLLLLLSAGSSLTAMEWIKGKLGYGPKQETYEEYLAARKRWIPLETWYVDEMIKLPLQWPADKNEQQKLVNQISEFAEKYERAWDSQDHINNQVTLYFSGLKDRPEANTPEAEAYRQKLLKQREVMKKALLEYRLLKIKESQEQEAELKKQRARL